MTLRFISYGNGVMIETSKNLKPWRAAVAAAARDIAADVGHEENPDG